ncbi:MAG: AAA family ATPase [Bacteroidaceae bacterium]|nr:AAA family ATPase [Bacteroidaceae bacterium]
MNNENQELEMARNYALYTHRNIFLTGKAGTGKTTFLRRLQQETRKRMIVVAPTGVAAINAGGVTIHSFFQLAPGLYLPGGQMIAGRDQRSRFSFSKQKLNILRSLDLLVIDEISMVRADLLDAIDEVLRRYQKRDQPFGGVQLLLIGDLQQLAPVATDEEWPVLQQFYQTPYFFSSLALQQTSFVYIELRHVYRQQDEHFVGLLNAVRDGRLDQATLQELNARYRPGFVPSDEEEWITLTTHNHQAAQINARKLSALPSQPVVFEATIKGDFPEMSYPTDDHLTLKVGAQVMFCKNDPSTAKAYYNGRIGRIERIADGKVTVVCRRASSATTSPEEVRYDRIEVAPQIWQNTKYATDSSTGIIREEIVGSFTQIPLRTAWAITIHKSQGLTFDRAIINAGRAFSHGQVYVALSRCRTLEGLVLSTPISPSVITTDPDVIQFEDHARDLIPTPTTFLKDRRSFVEDILCDTFDFRGISMRLRFFLRLVSEFMPYFPDYVAEVQAAAQETDARLMAVGVKFQTQIHELIQLADSYGANQPLRQRVHAAIAYYCKETANVLGDLMAKELPEVDNARGREQIEREFQFLKTDFDQKMNIFIACLSEFSLDAYWDAKARASMTEDTAPKKKASPRKRVSSRTATTTAKDNTSGLQQTTSQAPRSSRSRTPKAAVDTSVVRNPSLYRAIIDWRRDVARERKMPPAYVMPIRTVIALTNAQPDTPEALLAVPGIGDKTAADHGPDLLEIVARHRR